MDNVRMTGDVAYREELTSYIDESQFKSAFEHRYGRGWQRKLGAVLDVPETTVNGWFKSGRFPPLAKVAFGVLLSRHIRPHWNWIPVKNGGGYAVCDTRGPVGRIVADNITRLEDAMLLAAAPQLYEASGDAFVVFDDARDFMDGWGDLADKLRGGLDAATLGHSSNADGEEARELAPELPIDPSMNTETLPELLNLAKQFVESGEVETKEDITQRLTLLHLQNVAPSSSKKRMSARTERGLLVVEFANDKIAGRWELPDRSDKRAIHRIRDEAVIFSLEHGASHPGQTNAVKKALTDTGYYVTKARRWDA